MKHKYYAITTEPRNQVVWASDSMEAVKRHAVEDVELTGKIYGWESLGDEYFTVPQAYIVSGRRVVAAYYFRRGWQRESGPASVGQMEAIEKYLAPETRPEIISAGNPAPEAEPEAQEAPAAQAEPEAATEAVTMPPEAFRAFVEAAPRCGLLLDIQGDIVKYKTMDGRPRRIYAESITADKHVARIRYFNGGNHGQIALDKKHECYPVAAVVAGTVSIFDALHDIKTEAARIRGQVNKDKKEILSSRKPSGQRKEEAKEKVQRAVVLADQATCIIKNSQGGIPPYIANIARELEAVAVVARELNLSTSAGNRLEAVAAWLRDIDNACREAWKESATQRPEIISAGSPAPEAEPEAQEAPAAQAEPEQDAGTIILVETTYDISNGGSSTRKVVYTPGKGVETAPAEQEARKPAPAPEAIQPEPEKPEARPIRQPPEKPARGPGKPLDFIGQMLSGNGWKIIFDTDLQRTRVIIEEAARKKAAPLAEAAGFYYSVNTDSWHKKLSHKAHRAAEALAEKLRAAC